MLLHLFAVLVAASTAVLIFAGGLVTSTGSGLAVPDWPNTYGWFMFAFPLDKMVGGILYEHSHRLIASTVGFLILVLAFWLHRVEPRAWVRRLGQVTLTAVIIQGILGGITVLWFLPDAISISHAGLAQLVFCLTTTIALVTSRGWHRAYATAADPEFNVADNAGGGNGCLAQPAAAAAREQTLRSELRSPRLWMGVPRGWRSRDTRSRRRQQPFATTARPAVGDVEHGTAGPGSLLDDRILQRVAIVSTVAIYAQIILGATMRHTGAGLAIPDFPLAFGRLVPPEWSAAIAVHFAHRVGAVFVSILVLATAGHVFFHHPRRAELRRPAMLLLVLVTLQVTLGALTVLSAKHYLINSLHVVTGGMVLVTSLVLTLRAHRGRFPATTPRTDVPVPSSPAPLGAMRARA